MPLLRYNNTNMTNRSEASRAHSWGRHVQAIQATRERLDEQLANADNLDRYEELAVSLDPLDARRRNVAKQLFDRLARRFPDNDIEVFRSIYEQPTAGQKDQVFESPFDALWNEFHAQDPQKAAALMEERILPYYYGILQPDSSFPDRE